NGIFCPFYSYAAVQFVSTFYNDFIHLSILLQYLFSIFIFISYSSCSNFYYSFSDLSFFLLIFIPVSLFISCSCYNDVDKPCTIIIIPDINLKELSNSIYVALLHIFRKNPPFIIPSFSINAQVMFMNNIKFYYICKRFVII